MSSKTKVKGKVFLSGSVEKSTTWEHISPEHIIVFIYSGQMTLTYGQNPITFTGGDTILVPKNQLIRVVKAPLENESFEAASLLVPEEALRKFYLNRSVLDNWDKSIVKQRPITSHALLDSFFASLHPYFEMHDELPESLVNVKIQEVLTIIDEVDKRVSSILGSFDEIGKINLEKYMEEHFMYNLPLEKFAFLTGRSLTTFKADFKRIFNRTPGKWLMEKRLHLAYYKITNENKKAKEVYLSTGFENLSHFSFAFKKAFGYSPSTINRNKEQ